MIKIEIITHNSWKFNPINMSIPLEYNRILSFNELKLLKRGLKPKVMEDKCLCFRKRILYILFGAGLDIVFSP